VSRAVTPFDAFLMKMASSFRRIAYGAKVEEVGDLHGEAWIIASEIEERRGWAIDFSDHADQQLIIGRLYVLKVIRRDRNLLGALQVDQDDESEDGAPRLIDRLQAAPSSDPLAQLLAREDDREREKTLANSYSQAAAYLQTFTRFGQDRKRVCAYLCISRFSLYKRITNATDTYHRQKSLFDRKVKIGSRFMPQAGLRYVDSTRTQLISSQWGWDFEEHPGAGRVLTAAG
jgi:hypothetical protein